MGRSKWANPLAGEWISEVFIVVAGGTIEFPAGLGEPARLSSALFAAPSEPHIKMIERPSALTPPPRRTPCVLHPAGPRAHVAINSWIPTRPFRCPTPRPSIARKPRSTSSTCSRTKRLRMHVGHPKGILPPTFWSLPPVQGFTSSTQWLDDSACRPSSTPSLRRAPSGQHAPNINTLPANQIVTGLQLRLGPRSRSTNPRT